MKFKDICNDLNLNVTDRYYLLFLVLFSVLITLVMVRFHQSRGAFNSDTYVYLASALDYAGMNYGHISDLVYLHNSPVICYLTSLLFRLGFVSINSMFLVTAIFSVLGIFAMYIFLKIRFSNLLSLVGTLIYSSASLTLFYYANAMLDVPAVALIIWTLIFTVAAVDKNPKYYILAAILFVISFFTRFTTLYIISLIVLYMLKEYDLINLLECLIHDRNTFKQKIISFFRSSEFKWMCISLAVGFVIVLYVFYVISSYNAPIGYFNEAASSINKYSNPYDPNYITDKLFYIKNYLSLLFANDITSPMQIEKFRNPSVMAYLMVGILFLGFLIKFINIVKNKVYYRDNAEEIQFRSSKSSKILLALVFVFFILSVISFKFNYLYSTFLFWIVLLILQSLIKKYPVDGDNFSLSLVCFGLLGIHFIIFSFMDLKCVRYILPTFPAFAYFVIYALDNILDFIKYGWEDKTSLNSVNFRKIKSNLRLRASQAIPLIMIVLLLFTAFNFTNTVEIDEWGLNFDSASNFLIDYDPDYQSKGIGADVGDRYYEWYFKKNVDLLNFHDFNSSDYEYIFINYPLNNEDYHEIYHDGTIRLYQRN